MKPIVARPRTHTLVIEVPLHIDGTEDFDHNPVEEALRVVMAVSKLAVDGVVCGDVLVHLREVTP